MNANEFSSPVLLWLPLLTVLGIGAMGFARHGLSVEIAVLNGIFAFSFFTAFAAMFFSAPPSGDSNS